MVPKQIEVICDSFAKVRSMEPDFGARFYHHLIREYPESARLFGGLTMERQHTRFVDQLDIVLARMKEGQSVTPLLQGLGNLHHLFGVGSEDFRNFGKSLESVLQEILGNAFDEDVRQAWIEVYGDIAQSMMSAGDLRRPESPGPLPVSSPGD